MNKLTIYYIIKSAIFAPVFTATLFITSVLICSSYNGYYPLNSDTHPIHFLGNFYPFVSFSIQASFIVAPLILIMFCYRSFRELFFKRTYQYLIFIYGSLFYYFLFFFSGLGIWFFDS